MTDPDRPVGQLFSHIYEDRGLPGLDGDLFRGRLAGFLDDFQVSNREKLARYLKRETGLSVPKKRYKNDYDFEKFLAEISIHHVCNSITLIWRFFGEHFRTDLDQQWSEFVSRVLREENIGYELDAECGVHYLVDQEFERNRATTLRGLDQPRLANVRDAFEQAHHYLDTDPLDTKAAVRSMFESLEILTKLMVDTNNLNRWVIENKLKPLAQDGHVNDPTATETIGKVFNGFADWVDGLHNYRHGQGQEDPVAPPIELATYFVSSGAAFLRWLLEIDQAHQDEST